MNTTRFLCWTGGFSLVWTAVLALTRPFSPESVVLLITGVLAIAASVYDAHTFQLPDLFTVSGALTGVIGLGVWADEGGAALAGATFGFAGMKAVQLVCRRRRGADGIGSGDAVLMLSLGAMTGVTLLPVALALALFYVTLHMKILKRTKTPLGPFLTFGALVTVIAGDFV